MKRRPTIRMTAFLCIAAALTATMARADYSFTTIDPPGSDGGALALGINNAGQVVGTSLDVYFNGTGFLYSGGTFTFPSIPGASCVAASRDPVRRPRRSRGRGDASENRKHVTHENRAHLGPRGM